MSACRIVAERRAARANTRAAAKRRPSALKLEWAQPEVESGIFALQVRCVNHCATEPHDTTSPTGGVFADSAKQSSRSVGLRKSSTRVAWLSTTPALGPP